MAEVEMKRIPAGEAEPEPFDAGNPKHVKEAKNKAKRAAERRIADMRWVLSDRRGRRVLWELLGMGQVFGSTFNTNALSMGFAEGQRRVGLEILSRISEADPAAFAEMQLEQLQEEANG